MKFSSRRLPIRGKAYLFAVLCLTLVAGCGFGRGEGQQTQLSVTVRWAPSISDVVGYNVYRVAPGGVSGKLTQQIVRGTEFVDSTIEAEHFYSYFVTSVNAKGLESEPSERADVTVPKPGMASTLSRFFARIRRARSNTPVP